MQHVKNLFRLSKKSLQEQQWPPPTPLRISRLCALSWTSCARRTLRWRSVLVWRSRSATGTGLESCLARTPVLCSRISGWRFWSTRMIWSSSSRRTMSAWTKRRGYMESVWKQKNKKKQKNFNSVFFY